MKTFIHCLTLFLGCFAGQYVARVYQPMQKLNNLLWEQTVESPKQESKDLEVPIHDIDLKKVK